MINHTLVLRALRTQALTLTVATTGSTDLAATTTGYARATGSFVTDGFVVGMEVVPSGFTATTPGVITAVDATTLTILGGRTAEASASGRSLTVGLPPLRGWENTQYDPIVNRWYIDESYAPGPSSQITVGPLGEIEGDPQYTLNLYGVANTGPDALYVVADGVLALFPPRLALTLTNGDVVRVRQNPAPYRSALQPLDAGFACIPITIPCRYRVPNTI